MNKKINFITVFVINVSSMVVFDINILANITLMGKIPKNIIKVKMKFRTGVHAFCWEVGVFIRSCFQSVSCKEISPVTM